MSKRRSQQTDGSSYADKKPVFIVAVAVHVGKFLELRPPVVKIAEVLALVAACPGLNGAHAATLAAGTLLVKCLQTVVAWRNARVWVTQSVGNVVADFWELARWWHIPCTLIKHWLRA